MIIKTTVTTKIYDAEGHEIASHTGKASVPVLQATNVRAAVSRAHNEAGRHIVPAFEATAEFFPWGTDA